MKKIYILLAMAALVAFTGCKKEKADQTKYTDAILYNAYGDVDVVATYSYPLEQGQMNEINELIRCTYENGIVTCDYNYPFYTEPDEMILEMYGDDVDIPVVERDAQGRIVRTYIIEDDDTVSYTHTYNQKGLLERTVYRNYSNGDSELHTYTYDDNGWLASMVSRCDYETFASKDSVVYAVTQSDEAGNWTVRDSEHFSSETNYDDKSRRNSTTVDRKFSTRELRFLAYSNQEQQYSVYPDGPDEILHAETFEGVFGKDKKHVACKISVDQTAYATGIDIADVNRMAIEAAISGEGVKGSTLKDRAISAWGPAEKKLPVVDEAKWVADPDYISIIVLKREVSLYSGNNRTLSIMIDDEDSYSPTGDLDHTAQYSFCSYDIKTQKPIYAKDIFSEKRVDALMYKIQDWYGEELTWEQLSQTSFSISWPTINFQDPYLELYIPEFVGFMSEYGKEVLFYPSATQAMPMFD